MTSLSREVFVFLQTIACCSPKVQEQREYLCIMFDAFLLSCPDAIGNTTVCKRKTLLLLLLLMMTMMTTA
jgi:hypothetical protein